ncbi:HEAT repeat domain-containing protein [Halosimplex salinum]|uniref:HEAT repeat domain-containing protein n=1 Tax=Halosimplex salinum TaxID=1710538 RepID=UPI000F48D1CB|nr:hypothetical protein [Halosimplex salinum]
MVEDVSERVEGVDVESGELSEDESAVVREALASEKSFVRQKGVRVLDALAVEDVSAVEPFLDDLLALLEDERVSVAQAAGTVVLRVANESPGLFADGVSEAVSLTERDLAGIELLGAQILAQIVVDHPEYCSDEVDRLLAVLQDRSVSFDKSEGAEQFDDPNIEQALREQDKEEHEMRLQTQVVLSNVVIAIAEGVPEAYADSVDEVIALLDSPDTTIVAAGADVLSELAGEDPEAAAPAYDGLIGCLGHDDSRVRARGVRGLGLLGDDRAVGPLNDLAEAEPEEEIADLAAETAEFLDEQ